MVDFEIKTSDDFVAVSRASPRVAESQRFLELFDGCLESFMNSRRDRDLERRYRNR